MTHRNTIEPHVSWVAMRGFVLYEMQLSKNIKIMSWKRINAWPQNNAQCIIVSLRSEYFCDRKERRVACRRRGPIIILPTRNHPDLRECDVRWPVHSITAWWTQRWSPEAETPLPDPTRAGIQVQQTRSSTCPFTPMRALKDEESSIHSMLEFEDAANWVSIAKEWAKFATLTMKHFGEKDPEQGKSHGLAFWVYPLE